ncbi:hypothetical protein PVK06_032019 [Gossypium arboreum]|uniref:Uncharacterized protein n=1 Tax=Gossypium arboreum TaxID=29729 RepID=A0ABR0NSP0_GOSAR|nr:hypothetical protein PVK06_032019 [Gossypium arboreum]
MLLTRTKHTKPYTRESKPPLVRENKAAIQGFRHKPDYGGVLKIACQRRKKGREGGSCKDSEWQWKVEVERQGEGAVAAIEKEKEVMEKAATVAAADKAWGSG